MFSRILRVSLTKDSESSVQEMLKQQPNPGGETACRKERCIRMCGKSGSGSTITREWAEAE
jgi:hypothetical protein